MAQINGHQYDDYTLRLAERIGRYQDAIDTYLRARDTDEPHLDGFTIWNYSKVVSREGIGVWYQRNHIHVPRLDGNFILCSCSLMLPSPPTDGSYRLRMNTKHDQSQMTEGMREICLVSSGHINSFTQQPETVFVIQHQPRALGYFCSFCGPLDGQVAMVSEAKVDAAALCEVQENHQKGCRK